jgi:hypothetical protein
LDLLYRDLAHRQPVEGGAHGGEGLLLALGGSFQTTFIQDAAGGKAIAIFDCQAPCKGGLAHEEDVSHRLR